MNHPPTVAHELARRMLGHGAEGSTPAAAFERAWLRLAVGLEPLVGRGGADALVARAAKLARREFPFLGAVRLAAGEPADLSALHRSIAAEDEAVGGAAAVAVLEKLLGLLTGLLGEELGLWPVRAIWPDTADGARAPRSNDGEA